jgi:hypothetical protein
VGRYIKKFRTTGALGPTEERGVPLWAGYELAGIDEDLSEYGLIRVDGWSGDELAERGVKAFTSVDPQRLGIPRLR